MSPSHDANELLAKIEELKKSGDLVTAYSLVTNLRKLQESGEADTDADAVEKELDTISTESLDRIKRELDELLSVQKEEDFDIPRMRTLLDDMLKASRTTPIDYNTNLRLVADRELRRKHRLEYNAVSRLVEDYWQQARQRMQDDPDIAVSTLLTSYYNKALKLAEDAAGESEGNELIKSLVDRAGAEREKFAQEEEAMTSGAQREDFVRVFKHLDGLGVEDQPMVYNFGGVPLGRMSKEQAREEIVKQASTFYNDKLGQYLDDAQANLKALKVRQVERDLENRIDPLEELRNYVPDIARRDLRESLQDTRKKVREDLEKLGQAEDMVHEAEKRAPSDALSAWNLLEQALKEYGGADKDLVAGARSYIVQTMIANLREAINNIEELINVYDFDEAEQEATRLLDTYERVTDLKGSEVTLRLNELKKRASKSSQDTRKIVRELDTIYKQSAERPQDAAKRLSDLITDFGDLVKRDPSYDRVASRVNMTTNASSELERLERFLDVYDLPRIEEACRVAGDAIEAVEGKKLQDDFVEITQLLEYHKDYLEAQRTHVERGYESGRRAFQTLRDRFEGNKADPRWSEHWQKLKDRIDKRLAKIDEDRARLQENTENLEQAQDALNVDDIERAWRALLNVEKFSDTQEQARWFRLLGQSFDRLKIEMAFDNTQLDNLLRAADRDADFVHRWRSRLKHYQAVQLARDDEQAGNTDKAMKELSRIEEEVSSREKSYVRSYINQIAKRQSLAEKDELLNRLKAPDEQQRLYIDDGESHDDLVAELRESAHKYRERLRTATDECDRLDYQIWALEIELQCAQILRDSKSQVDLLNKVQDETPDLRRRFQRLLRSRQPQYEATLREAQRILEVATPAQKIGSALQAVQRNLNLSSDFGLFDESIKAWKAVLGEDQLNDTLEQGYAILIHWYDELVSEVRAELRQKIEEHNQDSKQDRLSPEILPYYAKLRMLNPDDDLGQAMIKELSDIDEHLRRQAVSLFSDLPFGRSQSGGHKARLEKQIEQFSVERDRLNNLSDIAQRLSAETVAVSPGYDKDHVVNVCRSYSSLLKNVIERLRIFRKEAEELQGYLKGFELTMDNWISYTKVIGDNWNAFMQTADRVGDDISEAIETSELANEMQEIKLSEIRNLHETHPTVIELEKDYKDTLAILDKIVDALTQVKELAEQEQFDEAHSLASSGVLKRRNFGTHPAIYATFSVQDIWQVREIMSWESITKWLQEKKRQFDRIEQWSRPFDVNLNTTAPDHVKSVVGWSHIKDTDIRERVEKAASSFNMIAEIHNHMVGLWQTGDLTQAVRYQILALVAQGDFDEAHELLDKALGVDQTEDVDGLSTLNKAWSIVRCPPLADADPQSDDENGDCDYELAIKCAGSTRGAAILKWMRDHRYQQYEEQKRDAERLKKEIIEAEKQWDELYRTFPNKIAPLGELVRKSENGGFLGFGGGLNNHDRARLDQTLNESKNHLNQMRETCPFHPDLTDLEKHPIIKEAQAL